MYKYLASLGLLNRNLADTKEEKEINRNEKIEKNRCFKARTPLKRERKESNIKL